MTNTPYRPTSPKEIARIARRRLNEIADAAEAYEDTYEDWKAAAAAYKVADADYEKFDGLAWKFDCEVRLAEKRRDYLGMAWFKLMAEWADGEAERRLPACDKLGRKAERCEDKLTDLEDAICDAY